jgi:aerobic-type carbon monoxide dehydrogenase small subunit (CoxS/CutS family)
MAREHVTMMVNGHEEDFLCEADQSLLSVLRDELGMTGTKEGCGTGDCGACSVTVDGRLVCWPTAKCCIRCRPSSSNMRRCNAASALRGS